MSHGRDSVRSVCELSRADCISLVKRHVPPLEQMCWNIDNWELVVSKHKELLCACAQKTARLNASVVQHSAKEVFGCTTTTAEKFAQAMVGAFGYCRAKYRQKSSGVKLSANVKEVVACFDPKGPPEDERAAKSSPPATQRAKTTAGVSPQPPWLWTEEKIAKWYAGETSPPRRSSGAASASGDVFVDLSGSPIGIESSQEMSPECKPFPSLVGTPKATCSTCVIYEEDMSLLAI